MNTPPRKKLLWLKAAKFLNILLVAIPFKFVWALNYSPLALAGHQNTIESDCLIMVIIFIVYSSLINIYDGFVISTLLSNLVLAQVISALLTDGLMFLIMWLVIGSFPTPLPMLIVILIQSCLIYIWCLVIRNIYRTLVHPRRSLYISDTPFPADFEREYGFASEFNINKTISLSEIEKEGYASLENTEIVFIADTETKAQSDLIKRCHILGIPVYLIPEAGTMIMHSGRNLHMFHHVLLRIRSYNPSIHYELQKRIIDLVFSGTALILVSPILLVTAVAIKLTDGGPVLYSQQRLTKNGKVFSIYKFRSMRVDAEKDGVARLSSGEQDDRVTAVGKVIRKYRIDELPQLINILKGDLSIVGPRPERPELHEVYTKYLPEFSLRLQVKAGLTGYAQVYGKYNTPPKEKLVMDLAYIDHASLLRDIRIMVATVKVLFIPESTEGISEGQTNAMKLEDDDSKVGTK